ncbi:hypothetical protein DVH05_028500 [Phytophthora capsici]|nr:hypothetical protein DVH05_028500 [Phytophthora capsici]
MVYSRTASTRSYVKAVALVAMSLAALPLATSLQDATTVACEVSDGDKSFGVRAVNDSGCANGGLGCYNDHCRFCKILDTPKSTQFESCSSFGASFGAMTAPTVTTGPCEISEGDAAVGIAAIVDNDCLYGGLGCFSDHCRFCKLKETPESTAFVGCADFNGATITTDGTTITAAPTTAPTTAPTLVVTTTTNAPATGASSCSLVVSEGDASVGINIVSDASCASGGVGCIDNVCRFCRSTTTVQSAAFTDCNSIAGATITTNAPTTAPVDTPTVTPTDAPTELPTEAPTATNTCQLVASDGDVRVGINLVTDATCATGGIGCVTDVCRYCRLVYTEQSKAFTDCGTVQGSAATAAPTQAPTNPPADTPTVAPIDTVAPTPAPPAQPTCSQVVSAGDASVGINIVTDATCANGGAGCIDNLCRFCKVLSTIQSAAFPDCTSISGYSTGPVTVTTDAPTNAVTTAPTAAATDAPTDAPTNAPAAASTDVPTAATPASSGACTQTVSDGDAAVGINIVTDTTCANGGAGCIDNVCRFCKVLNTIQSAAFVDCTSITSYSTGAVATTDAPTNAVTTAPTDAPTAAPTDAPTNAPVAASTDAPATPTSSGACTQTVSDGDAAVGINIVTDTSCANGGVGCIDNVCRFCKTRSTDQSAAFLDCPSV